VADLKGVLLLSGGIDSPVAGAMMLERGLDLVLLHMDNRPFTDDREFAKVLGLVQRLSALAGKSLEAYAAPHGMAAQPILAKLCERRFHCILCRRMMLRTADALARKMSADFIVTGESLGQVASQTLRNILAEDGAATHPVLRPLIGMDKSEVVARGRMLGTFEVSTAPGLCCTIVPDKPATAADIERIIKEEGKLDVAEIAERETAGLRRIGG
jgi:thiamine biosynthesis protein ThiI